MKSEVAPTHDTVRPEHLRTTALLGIRMSRGDRPNGAKIALSQKCRIPLRLTSTLFTYVNAFVLPLSWRRARRRSGRTSHLSGRLACFPVSPVHACRTCKGMSWRRHQATISRPSASYVQTRSAKAHWKNLPCILSERRRDKSGFF